MCIWCGFKVLGCVVMCDGVYLFLVDVECEQVLQVLVEDCQCEGGSVWLMVVQFCSVDEELVYCQFFDCYDVYVEFCKIWKDVYVGLVFLVFVDLIWLWCKL